MIWILFSGPVLLLGILLLIRSIRGRLVSDQPHCRSCRFDLHGLTLSDESVCPECGHLTIPDTYQVMDGLRRVRRGLLVVSILMMLAGTSGLIAPKIKSFQNIDWYAKFPEPVLILLDGRGNKKAFNQLHSRILPGQLSDEGLSTLVDRAIGVLEDPNAVWNERLGDVLLYSFLEEKLDKEQFASYVESSILITAETYKEIGYDIQHLQYQLRSEKPTRGESSFQFRNELVRYQTGNPIAFDRDLQSPYSMDIDVFSPIVKGSNARRRSSGGWATESMGQLDSIGWIPFRQYSSGLGSTMPFEYEGDEIVLEFAFECTVTIGDKVAHSWEFTIEKTILRNENPVYAVAMDDPSSIERALDSVEMISVSVPTDLHLLDEHEYLRDHFVDMFSVRNHSGYALMGRISFQVDGIEYDFSDSRISPDSVHGFHVQNAKDHSSQWWKYFQSNRTFWDLVKKKGAVDVIIRPNLELGKKYLEIDEVINVPIIFRDVPVNFNAPKKQDSFDSNDVVYEWESRGYSISPKSTIKAEILEEENELKP